MLNIVRNREGSVSPLITGFVLILMLGLLFGMAGIILAPAVTTSLNIDWLMWNIFLALPIIGLFIIGSWVIVKAQRSK